MRVRVRGLMKKEMKIFTGERKISRGKFRERVSQSVKERKKERKKER